MNPGPAKPRPKHRVFATRHSGWSITDSRGRRVPLFPLGLTPGLSLAPPPGMDPATFFQLHFAFHRPWMRKMRRIFSRIYLVAFLGVIGLWLTLVLSKPGPMTGPVLWGIGIPLTICVGVILLLLLISLFARLWCYAPRVVRRIAPLHINAGRCPSCAHATLRGQGIAPDADGLTTCSNCHAAWDINEVPFQVHWVPSLFLPAVVTGDHRGRMIEVFSHGRWLSGGDNALSMSPGEIKDVRKAAMALNPSLQARRKGVLFSVGFMTIWLTIRMIMDGPMSVLHSPFSLFWLAVCIWGFWTVRRSMGESPRQIVEIMLKRKRCPACTYSLDGIPPQADGCVVCPECAAAWKLEAPPNQTTRAPAANTASTGLPPSS